MTKHDDTLASSASTTDNAAQDQQAATPVDTSAQDANNTISADTSAAGDKGATATEEPKSLLDVIKDVVDPAEAANAESKNSPDLAKTEGNATEQKQEDGSVDDANQSPAEGEDSKLPFHKHPRFQQVIQERATFKRELETLKPDAEEWRSVKTYMSTNNLSTDEVAKGFEIMAAMKNDPLRGRELLSHYWNSLQAFAGEVLPQDLQQRVNDGEVTDDVAAELARRRNEAEFLRQQQQESNRRQQEQYAQQQQAQFQQVIKGSVIEWENNIKTRDADYSVKQPFLMDKVRAAIATNPPRNQQDAIAIVEQAYREVNESLKRFTPQRQAATTIRSEVSSANVAPQPKTLRDAVRLAAAGQI